MSYHADDLLKHILNETNYLLENSDISEEQFMCDETLQRAFVRSLEIIGEASSKMPVEIKTSYPEILWREMAGLRNRLIHDYFGIDYEIVWDIVKNEVPELNNQIKEILEKS